MNVKELLERYSLSSRKSLYSRLEAAQIKLPKDDDGKAYATEQMIRQLDDLDRHIKNGGTLKSYTPVTPVTTYPETFDNGHYRYIMRMSQIIAGFLKYTSVERKAES